MTLTIRMKRSARPDYVIDHTSEIDLSYDCVQVEYIALDLGRDFPKDHLKQADSIQLTVGFVLTYSSRDRLSTPFVPE